MKKRFLSTFLLVALLILLSTTFSHAAEKELNVKEHVLPNGLTLLIVEDHSAPVAACYRFHKVGGVNEYSNMFGCSHLLEHMMFKGTKKIGTWDYKAEVPIMQKIEKLVDEIDKERAKSLNCYQKPDKKKMARLWEEVKKLQQEQRKYIRKNEIDFLYRSQGGVGLNASTGYDETNYYITVPSNKLELWAFIESDRMSEPVFREFYSERDVVYEERRMRTENDPFGVLFENFFSHFYVAIPYGQDVVGWASDIESLRRNKVMAYLKKYYSPGNTILSVVGDVKEAEVLALVKKYFSSIPSQPLPEPIYAEEPEQSGERRIMVKFDANPRVIIGYHGPRPGDPDEFVLDVISYLLSKGRTSRFYKNLVKTDIAYQVSGWNWTFGYSNSFVVIGSPKTPKTTDDFEKSVYAELEKLKTEPVSQKDLEKIHNQVDAEHLNMMNDRMTVAQNIANSKAWTGSWKNYDRRARIKAVTPEDIMRVAKKYFTSDNRTVAVQIKKEEKKESDEEEKTAVKAPEAGKEGK